MSVQYKATLSQDGTLLDTLQLRRLHNFKSCLLRDLEGFLPADDYKEALAFIQEWGAKHYAAQSYQRGVLLQLEVIQPNT